MKLYWSAHTLTDPKRWEEFSFFDGARVTWFPEKTLHNIPFKEIEYTKDLIASERKYEPSWGFCKQQLVLAKKHNQKIIVSIMPEKEIPLETFRSYCEQLKNRFSNNPTIEAWDNGTEPGIVTDYGYEKYLEYYKIAIEILKPYTAPGFTVTHQYNEFLRWVGDIPIATFPDFGSFHLYDSFNNRRKMVEKMVRFSRMKWITETGWSSEPKWWHWFLRTNGQKEQLKAAIKCIQLYKDFGIDLVVIYNWKDDPNTPSTDKFSRHCGLLDKDGNPKLLFNWLKEKNHDKH